MRRLASGGARVPSTATRSPVSRLSAPHEWLFGAQASESPGSCVRRRSVATCTCGLSTEDRTKPSSCSGRERSVPAIPCGRHPDRGNATARHASRSRCEMSTTGSPKNTVRAFMSIALQLASWRSAASRRLSEARELIVRLQHLVAAQPALIRSPPRSSTLFEDRHRTRRRRTTRPSLGFARHNFHIGETARRMSIHRVVESQPCREPTKRLPRNLPPDNSRSSC